MPARTSDEKGVCLSVCQTHRSVKNFMPCEIRFSLVFKEEKWLVGATLLPEILGRPAPLERNGRFWTDTRSQRLSRNIWRKTSINTNRKSTTRFPLSLKWTWFVLPGLQNAKRPFFLWNRTWVEAAVYEECEWLSYLQVLLRQHVIAHYLANCVYSFLCWVVEEYVIVFSVVLIWDIFGVHHIPWCASPKRPAAWKTVAKCMKSNASDRQKCSFRSKHGGNISYYTFTQLEECRVSSVSLSIFVWYVPRPTIHNPEASQQCSFQQNVFSICSGIRKSAEHIFKSNKIFFVKNREGAPEVPLRIEGDRSLGRTISSRR